MTGLLQRAGREPAIDGVRAIAVVSVVAYHTGLAGVKGGFVGVDVFFVVSGYIITRLLVREFAQTGSIDLPAFYARRVRRLLPAALTMMLGTILLSSFVLLPALGEPQTFVKSLIRALGFQANHFFLASTGGYFNWATDEQPMMHMWSLSVEEQFYLAWPFLLFLSLTKVNLKWRTIAVLAGTLASFAASVYYMQRWPAGSFFLAPLRAWELGVGVLAALVVVHGPAWHNKLATAATVVGFVAVIASITLYTKDTSFPGYTALLPVMGTWALLLGIYYDTTSPIYRLLASGVCVAIGSLSFGWYLWHWPLLVLQKIGSLGAAPTWQRAVASLVALGIAGLSYRYIEEPARHSSYAARLSSWLTIGAGVTASAAVALLAVAYGYHSKIHAHDVDPDPLIASALRANEDVGSSRDCALGAHVLHCSLTAANAGGRLPKLVVIIGDSHAQSWEPFARRMAEARGMDFVSIIHRGCPMAPHVLVTTVVCREFNDRAIAELSTGRMLNRQVSTVLIASRRQWLWSARETSEARTPTTADFAHRDQTIDSGLVYAVDKLVNSSIEHVVLLAPLPELRNLSLRCVLKHMETWCGMPRSLYVGLRAPIVRDFGAMARTSDKVSIVDPIDFFCGPAQCLVHRGLEVLYVDDNHPSASAVDAFFAFTGASRDSIQP